MLHKELWQTDNEEWIKDRKKEWLVVKPNVEEINLTSSKDIKGLRHFFIYGEVINGLEFPQMKGLSGETISLFFKLWFIPVLTKGIIEDEINLAHKNELINFSHDFFQLAGFPNSSTRPDGLMAGRERYICHVMYHDSFQVFCQYSKLHYSEDKLQSYAASFFGAFNSSIHDWFRDGFPVNNAYQWMIPVWKDCIQYLPEKSYGRKNRFLRWLMEILSPDYHQPHFDTDDRYQKVATELREYILSDESPEALKEVWREVHQG